MNTYVRVLPYPSDLKLTVHAAGPDEAEIVLGLMNECCDWLNVTGKGHNIGVDQWPDRFELADILDQLDGGEFYFAQYDGRLAATFRFTDHPIHVIAENPFGGIFQKELDLERGRVG